MFPAAPGGAAFASGGHATPGDPFFRTVPQTLFAEPPASSSKFAPLCARAIPPATTAPRSHPRSRASSSAFPNRSRYSEKRRESALSFRKPRHHFFARNPEGFGLPPTSITLLKGEIDSFKGASFREGFLPSPRAERSRVVPELSALGWPSCGPCAPSSCACAVHQQRV